MLTLVLAVASPALAASPPAWELISSHTPAQIPLAEPVDQVESVTVAGEGATPYVGRFSLECENEAGEVGETRPLRYAASAAEVRVALEAVSTIGDANVKVTGGPGRDGGRGQKGWSYVVTFTGALAGRDVTLEAEELDASATEESAVEKAGGEPEEGSVDVNVTTPGRRATVTYELIATNIGGSPTTGTVTVTDMLPAGLSTITTPDGQGWTCTPPGEAQTTVTCVSEAVVNPGARTTPITIEAYVDVTRIKEREQLINRATISGGGASAQGQASDPAISARVAFPSRSVRGRAPGGPSSVGSAQIAALLVSQLAPTGTSARIAALLKRGGFTVSFRALEPGTAVIDWYEVPPGAKLAKNTKPKPVLVGAGRLRFSAAGTAKIRIRLTVAGKRLLRHARQLRLTARGTFTPTGEARVTATRTFLLRR
jgi:uncharacterized repeat protein (TIGR01451 family)